MLILPSFVILQLLTMSFNINFTMNICIFLYILLFSFNPLGDKRCWKSIKYKWCVARLLWVTINLLTASYCSPITGLTGLQLKYILIWWSYDCWQQTWAKKTFSMLLLRQQVATVQSLNSPRDPSPVFRKKYLTSSLEKQKETFDTKNKVWTFDVWRTLLFYYV